MPKETQANADPTAAGAAEDRAAVEELAKALGIDALQDAEHVEEQEPAVEDAEEPTEEPTEESTEEPIEDPAEDVGELPAEIAADPHKLRSWLGRRMAEREERLESRIIGTIQDLLKPKEEVKKYDPVEIPDIDEDLDEIPTKKDVLQLVRKMTEADKNKESQYWGRYSENLTTLAKGDKLNPEIIKAVAEELGQNMKNPVVHSDPAICAKLNYQAALINVLRKTPAKPEKKVPGSGEKTTVATGTITTQKTDRKPEPETNLDAESKRLARAFGLTDDKVKTILKKKEK